MIQKESQQRLSSVGADYNNRNDYFNTGQSSRAELNFTRYLEDQARYQGKPLDRGTNYLQYDEYDDNRDIQGKNEFYRVK